ncbi:unnamed protein product [Cuscuta campestris]|uniref:Bromo domain-containing protein n=1 Tax=Cuscuta campestris TaxID=132261 RepID=A0A484LS53_9ASTE|nr:unnamed protein product [Cuscuta campestris]
MDSGLIDLISRERVRWGDACKVYTRKGKRKAACRADYVETYAAAAATTTSTPQANIPNGDTPTEKSDVRQPNLQTLPSNGDSQREKSGVQDPNLQPLESQGPKLPNQDNEQRDSRNQIQATLSVSPIRDAGTRHRKVVVSNRKKRQDDGIEPVGELDGSYGFRHVVLENNTDKPDGCRPVLQGNHAGKPNGIVGCEPLVLENCINESGGSVPCQQMVQDNHRDKPDGIPECQPVVQGNHTNEPNGSHCSPPMVQDNHTDELNGSMGCRSMVKPNHIDKPNVNFCCQPVVEDKHIDKIDERIDCQPIMQDNHLQKTDGTLPQMPARQDNPIEETNVSSQCQQPVLQDNELLSMHRAEIEMVKSSPIFTRMEDKVRINFSGVRPADEIRDLMKKLENELYQVRVLVNKIEANEQHQLTAYDNDVDVDNIGSSCAISGDFVHALGQPQFPQNYAIKNRTLMRVNSEIGSVGHQFRPPSIVVTERNHGVGELLEKEKRTPKANQFYANSEFLLGKDRLPTESNKKSKPNGSRKKHGNEFGRGFGFGYEKHKNQVFRKCSALLQKLMKHNFGWVFNTPVDVYALGLHDYHDIIKHPMDLGTIKTRLSQNWYKSPREFAEDVRLVFRNAMIYNPKGQDVHIMAEQMSKMFEERWAVIESEYNPNWSVQIYHDSGLPTPTSTKTAPPTFAPAPLSANIPASQTRTFDRSESITRSADTRRKSSFPFRTPAPKKPKARDPNKRDMSYEEKQKLSTNLQSLPSDKLDAVVQIIKKRNSTLSQHDDEIEVDIDSVDAETLWELDRFVTNHKKCLSKNRKKAEIARAREAQTTAVTAPFPEVADSQNASRGGKGNYPPTTSPPPAQGERLVDNASRSSSSSSSSSSDSGSSSSDSDSDSSSAYGSDAGR